MSVVKRGGGSITLLLFGWNWGSINFGSNPAKAAVRRFSPSQSTNANLRRINFTRGWTEEDSPSPDPTVNLWNDDLRGEDPPRHLISLEEWDKAGRIRLR